MSDATDSQHDTISTSGTTPQLVGGCDPVVSGVVSHGTYDAVVVARQRGGTNRATWRVQFAYYVDDGGDITIDGGLQTLVHQSVGLAALTWAVSPVVSSGRVYLQVTGSVGLTVDWGANYEAYWAYDD